MRGLAFSLAFLAWLSAAEWKVLQRLLYSDSESMRFVVESVRGVLAGTPVSKSWQHRFVGPLLVSLFGGVTVDGVLRVAAVTLFASNLLLFALVRRRGARNVDAIASVICLGLAHFVLAYKLEYPWDGVDQLVFIAFGVWAAQGGRLLPLVPLLLLGTFNHETALYIPVWYLLANDRRDKLTAVGSAAVMVTLIATARAAFYVGRPALENQVFETPVPLLENHLHVLHNLRALFVDNWSFGRGHLTFGFLGATLGFMWLARRSETLRRAAWWSLIVLATIVCFGYVNETRHYLVLVAFWLPLLSIGRTASLPARTIG